MGEYITGILAGIKISDILDILIVTFLVYELMGFLKSSRAAQLAKGIVIIIAIAFISELCHFYVLSWLISKILNIGLIALVVVFQPELRRGLDYLGRSKLNINKAIEPRYQQSEVVSALVEAAGYFSDEKEGAIIVIERETALDDVAESGTVLDSKISAEAIKNIFYKGAPLHDGAVILRGDRIYAAGCVLPLTQSQNLSRDLGTRHRAGIGISEISDALVVIVSEETGIISTVKNGKLSRFLDLKSLEKQLSEIYADEGIEENFLSKLVNSWRKPNGEK